MLVPKRTKHRREFRGKMRGEAKGGKTVAFGEYGCKQLIHIGSQTAKLKHLVSQ